MTATVPDSPWLGSADLSSELTHDEVILEGRALVEMGAEERSPIRERWMAEIFRQASEEIPFYRRLCERRGLEVRNLERLEDWPLWNVSDLRAELADHPPFGELYLPELSADVAFIHSSTGTTGTPRLVHLCTADAARMTATFRRFYAMMGVRPSDVCCVVMSFGIPTGAWSVTRAIRSVGATVVPAGSGKVTPPSKLLEIIDSAKATVITGTPSYLLYIARQAAREGRDLRGCSVRLLLLSAESAGPEVRAELEALWGADSRSFYANSDVGWVALECDASAASHGALGMHWFDDVTWVEIVDADGHGVADGELGEVVITSRVRPSSPRIRFATGDLAACTTEACACGASSPRLMPITGRVDDALRYHGVTIWPATVESVLHRVLGRAAEFVLEVRRSDHDREDLVITVEQDDTVPIEVVSKRLQEAIGVRFEVEAVDVGTLTATTTVDAGHKVRRIAR